MAELTVTLERKGEIQHIHTGSGLLGDMSINYTDVPENKRDGVAKQLLATSALHCFCSSFGKALETRGAKYNKIAGSATVQTGVDEKKRVRITGVTLDVTVYMDEDYEFIFERVEKIMQQGCFVTASLETAFPVTTRCTMNPDG
ncbi:MAG: OsmC family protein [Desulfovibrio sp.]|jgi:osmotically inducible protein OsmC|nr:OsmC family protein [Desulfovibrio sp.]